MRLSLVPRPFFNLPSAFDTDDELWSSVPQSSGISVSQDDLQVYVTAATPGLDEKDIEVTFDKGVLWIKGERAETEEDKQKKYFRRAESSFSYRIAVPGDIDLAKDPEATYKNGVMTVAFAKSPAALPKKIAVKQGK